jgi:hypothetical protein
LRRRSATSVGVSFSVDVGLLATDRDDAVDCGGVAGALRLGRVKDRGANRDWSDAAAHKRA